MWATTLLDHPEPRLQWGIVLGASLVAALTDLRSRRIPNLLTLPVFATGLIVAGLIGGTSGLVDSVGASLVLALPFVLLFAFAGGGAGDAKLMGALGAWLGMALGTVLLVAVCLSGIVLGVVFALSTGRFSHLMSDLGRLAKGTMTPLFGLGSFRDVQVLLPKPERCQKMPYGLAIFAGALLSLGSFLLWQP